VVTRTTPPAVVLDVRAAAELLADSPRALVRRRPHEARMVRLRRVEVRRVEVGHLQGLREQNGFEKTIGMFPQSPNIEQN
jgi:hypothetical protein